MPSLTDHNGELAPHYGTLKRGKHAKRINTNIRYYIHFIVIGM